MVSRITLTFNGQVTLDTGAIQVLAGSTGSTLVNTNISAVDVGGKTIVTITFTSGAFSYARGVGFALNDGNYRVRVDAAKVHAVGGGVTALSGDVVDAFFRFYGDWDGDRDVDGIDYGKFREATSNAALRRSLITTATRR